MEARAVEQAWQYQRIEKQHLLADGQEQQQQEQPWGLADRKAVKKKKKPRTVKLGGTSSSSRWRWRVKLGTRKMKLKLSIFSPAASVLRRLRDAYVNSMLAFSRNKNTASLVMNGHSVSTSLPPAASVVKPTATTVSKSRSSRSPSLVSWNSNSQVMSNRDLQRLCSLHLHMERS